MKYEHIFLPMPRHLLQADISVDHEFGPCLFRYAGMMSGHAGDGGTDAFPAHDPVMTCGPYALDLHDYRIPDTQRKADHAMFDRYFGIARVNMDVSSVDMLGASCIVVMSAFMAVKQAEWSYNPEQSRSIIHGIRTVLEWVLLHHGPDPGLHGHDTFHHARAASPLAPDSQGNDAAPARILNRWKVGHQIFFILIQGILLCSRMISTVSDPGKVDTLIQGLRDVLIASRSAMELAGDMLPADYVSIVRPHMSRMSPSFSGLFLEDHAVMLVEFRKINQKIGADSRSALVGIISELYEAHAGVCEHVTGKDRQSLMSARHKSAGLSASQDLRTKWLKRAISRFESPDQPASCPF
ncbi:hypothetical protein CT154_08460 [Komagataeibacter xylinus]|nr:hypothetical protein CT154_08460 [Komagataeibacter xylinus]SAY46787.1 hypothetical protein KRIGEM_03146 [Komagataeibacter rhaeticus]